MEEDNDNDIRTFGGGRGDDDDDDEGRGGSSGGWGGGRDDDDDDRGGSWGGSRGGSSRGGSRGGRGSSQHNRRPGGIFGNNRGRNDNDWWDRDDDDNDWWSKIFGRSKYKKKRRPLNRSYAYRRRYVNPNSFLKNWWLQFITPTFGWPWPASPIIPPYTGLPLPGYGGGYGTAPYGYPPGYGVPGLITPTPSYTPPLPVPISYKTTPGYPYNTVTPQYSSPYYY